MNEWIDNVMNNNMQGDINQEWENENLVFWSWKQSFENVMQLVGNNQQIQQEAAKITWALAAKNFKYKLTDIIKFNYEIYSNLSKVYKFFLWFVFFI